MDKAQWAKSSNGPDWTDVEMGLRALDAVFGGRTTVTISPEGISSSGGLIIQIATLFENVPGGLEPTLIVSESKWPCKQCATFPGHVLGGIYKQDFNIGEAHQQSRLWPE